MNSETEILPVLRPAPLSPRPVSDRNGAVLRARGLSKVFGGREVLRNIDLTIVAGECVAIVGRSGSGKSTLLRLLAGIDRPTTGEVRINGDLVRPADSRVRVMFQESRLLPWKRVLANVRTGLPRGAAERAKDLLMEVGLAGRGEDWPGKLSGGQQQRVALARALAARPDLLLLDEPLGALDALTRGEMQRLIENLWRELGFTLVLVTHDVEEAIALADRVFVLADGSWDTVVSVDLPRPRDRTNPVFIRRRVELLNRILGSENI